MAAVCLWAIYVPSACPSSPMIGPFLTIRTGMVALIPVTTAIAIPAQSWSELSPSTNPPPRRGALLVEQPFFGGLLLFGGIDPTAPQATALNDTWIFNGTTWSQVATSSAPSARSNYAMATEAGRGDIVLFGGEDASGAVLNDTWVYSAFSSTWQASPPQASLSARRDAGMAFMVDPAGSTVVLFGGQDAATGVPLNDTWKWNGFNWTQVQPLTSPPGRSGPAMAFDATRNRIVMFGGFDGSYRADTWEFDGTDWTQVATPWAPSARTAATMAFGNQINRCVLYGGETSVGIAADCWLFDGQTWSPNLGVAPSLRRPALGSTGGTLVLFGGSDSSGSVVYDDTYALDVGAGALATPFGQGCAGSTGVPTLAARNTPVLGQGFILDAGALPSAGGTVLLALGFSRTEWNGQPLPLDLATVGMPGCKALIATDDWFLLTHSGATSLTINVPATATLFNQVFFTQALSLDSAAGNRANAAVSNAVEAVIR